MRTGVSLLDSTKATGREAPALFILLALCTMLLAACGSGSNGATTSKHVLTAICSVGGSYTEDMSPFSPNANCGVEGLLFENLEYVNGVTGKETPVLALSHTWSTDGKTLTFNLRTGVTWSDGQAFSSADVAFTFNLLKQYPDADTNGLWTKLASVTASDPNTVVMTFATPAPTLLPFIEGTYIVPQHLWQSAGDPAKFTNTSNPVGTGPMKLASFSAQLIKYTKNSSFWNASQVQVDELDYPVVDSNNTALLEMASHQADWTGIFSASLQQAFVSKSPAINHVYMVPVVPVQMVPNLKNPLLGNVKVRQAISDALDRSQMSASGEAGLEQVASPTGLMPGQEAYLDPKYNGQLPTFGPADPTTADSTLQSAGFTKGSDGYYHDAQGRELSFKVTVPGDFSDYVQDLQIAQQNLQAAGIKLTLNEVSDNDWRSDRASHNFDLIMTGGFFGPTPWYYLNPLLNSTGISGANATNWEQWNDKTTDQLLNQYASSTDTTAQTQDLQQLTDIMANDLPVIPVLDAIQFFEYTTAHWSGWPTPQNPYAIGSAYPLAAGDNEQVVLHLQWVG
jgi:peptide/nickel transport system substrate-binding protein